MEFSTKTDIEGFVLAGGASSRMGADKASVLLGGVALAERAVRTLLGVCEQVYLVGGEARSDMAASIADMQHPAAKGRRAAINGLYTAFSHCKTRFAAVLACDMPFVTADLFAFMADEIGVKDRKGFDAVIPREADGRIQPLCAVYKKEPCLEKLRMMQMDRVPAMREFAASLNVRYVEHRELARFGEPNILLSNVNTPAELAAAEERLGLNSIAADGLS